jgi:hypothetical protein
MEHKLALALRTTLAEDIGTDEGKKQFPIKLSYDKFAMNVLLDDKPLLPEKEAAKIANGIRSMSAQVSMDAKGNQGQTSTQLTNAPRDLRADLIAINTQVLQSLGVLSVPLPSEPLEPDKTWTSQRPLMVGSLGMYVPAVTTMEYKYLGTRVRDGKTEAVMRLTGTVRGRAGRGQNIAGTVKGTCAVAADTGEVVDARANIKVDMDLKIDKAGGTFDVSVKRLDPKPAGEKK